MLKGYANSTALEVECSFSAFVGVENSGEPLQLVKFFVINGTEIPLLSFETSVKLNLLRIGLGSADSKAINFIEADHKTKPVAEFPKIPIEGVRFRVNPDAIPKQIIRYNIPKAFEIATNERLRKMESKGIIERADKDNHIVTSVSPLVLVPKGGKDFRIVVDYREVNKAIVREPYPLPSLERIWSEIPSKGGQLKFTKLDLSDAFFHIELHEDVRHLTTFMTANGLMRFRRLPFGLSCAPELFQKVMERLLINCKGVIVYLDDILIFGSDQEELNLRVSKVHDVLTKNNLTINTKKSMYNQSSIDFLGFTIDGTGILPTEAKITDIKYFQRPKDVPELRSFLGVATFISPFIQNFSHKTKPLRDLLTQAKFEWTEQHQTAFDDLKNTIENDLVKRGYFNENDKIILYTDASPWGLGAFLIQEDSISQEKRIIACASKSLTETESRYPQLHREALAIVWAMERFSYYLLGRHFTLRSDSKALMFMLKHREHRDSGKRIMSRAEGWFLRLEHFDYKFEHIAGKTNIADAPSRISKKRDDPEFDAGKEPHELCAVTSEPDSITQQFMALTNEQVCQSMNDDEEIQLVIKWLDKREKWPERILKYQAFQDEMYAQGSSLMKREKLVLPMALRNRALKIAHTSHPGTSTMKNLLRQGLWWPGIDRDIEAYVRSCPECQLVSKTSRPLPIVLTTLPENVWDYVSMDFSTASDSEKWKALVLTDHYSRFLVAVPMDKTDTETTKRVLKRIFQTYYIPKTLKADNGPPFNSTELKKWLMETYGIRIEHSTPLNPTENGLVERSMQGINKITAIARLGKKSWKDSLAEYVAAYNTWPHHSTRIPPAELMFGRAVRSTLPNLKVDQRQNADEEMRDRDRDTKFRRNTREDERRGARKSEIKIGDTVLVAQQKRDKADTPFKNSVHKVVNITGAGRVTVAETGSGRVFDRNVKHLKKFVKPEESLNPEDKSNNKPESSKHFIATIGYLNLK